MANYNIGVWESAKSLLKLIFVLPVLIAWDKAKEWAKAFWAKLKP